MADSLPAQATPDTSNDAVRQYIEEKRYIEEPEILPWYVKDLPDLEPTTRELFETYSKIPSNEVVSHIKKTRDQAFKVFPYPCLGHWGFLNLSIGTSNAYQEILERLKNGEQYLDLGCCVGQDIRKLVHDGAPSQNMYGSDLKASFWDIGYELFSDKSTLATAFIEADIFDANSNLHKLDGKVDIVNAASFFHLFNRDQQVTAAKNVVQLLRSSPGSLLVGRQGGRVEAGEFTSRVERETSMYWHNPESFAKFWKQVGEETGSEWKVDAYFDETVDLRRKARSGMAHLIPQDSKMMKFIVRRV